MNDTPQLLSGQLSAPPAPGATIECRPNRDRQGLIVLFLGMGWLLPLALPILAPESETKLYDAALFFLLLGFILFPLAAYQAWFMSCYRITTDEQGLTWWRSFKRWHARWNQVEDYYEEKLAQAKTRRVVRTQSGTLTFVDGAGLTNLPELCEAIVNRAQWSRARQWHVKGTELEPGQTLVFRYNLQSMQRDMMFVGLACLVLLLLQLFKGGTKDLWTFPSTIAQIWSQLNWPLAIGLIFVLLSPVILLFALYLLPLVGSYQQAKSRCDETIEVNAQGTTFNRGATPIRAAWAEITDYYVTDTVGWFQIPRRYVIVTQRGTFDFTLIGNATQLRELIQRYATAVESPKWRYHVQDSAITNDAFSSTISPAEKRFTYRTRDNRALLLLPTVITIIMFAVPSLARGQVHPGSLGAFVAVMMLCAWGWWHYFFSAIVVDKMGISQWHGRRMRFIAWQEVKDYYRGSFSDIVEGDNARISFFPMITGGDRLRRFVQRHAGCGYKEWEQR